jgi:hypothetical protein
VYAGKPCAALDRQYLRDLFEVMLLQQAACIERVLVDVFLGVPAERRPAIAPRSVRVRSNLKLSVTEKMSATGVLHRRCLSQWCLPRDSYGFLATTLPFSQTQIGVPYIRAVFCASFAARRRARPTPAAKLGGWVCFARVFGFINLSPIVVGRVPNCRTPPSCQPMGGRCAESFPILLQTSEGHQPLEHCGRLDAL